MGPGFYRDEQLNFIAWNNCNSCVCDCTDEEVYPFRRCYRKERGVLAVAVRIAIVAAVIGYATWLFGSGRPGTSFPIPGLILVILIILYYLITERTSFGRHVYAVGGNKSAAELSGVNVKRTYFLTMLNMSVLAAVAGTWIISCHYFHYTALWFLPVNLPMVLLVPVEIIGGAFLIFSEAIGLHIPFLAILIDEGYSAISCIASTAASIPSSGIRNIFINPWCIPVYFIGIGVLSEALRSRRAPFCTCRKSFHCNMGHCHYSLWPKHYT